MTDPTAVPPAMSAEEWEQLRAGTLDLYADFVEGEHEHKIAAACLYQQPYGFTREDVRELENAADHHDWVDSVEANRIRSIAARLAALLPPHD